MRAFVIISAVLLGCVWAPQLGAQSHVNGTSEHQPDPFSNKGLRTIDQNAFDVDFRKDSTYVYKRDGSESLWIPSRRNVYDYDSEGRHRRTHTAGKEDSQSWIPLSRTDFHYDADDRVILEVFESWDVASSSYVPQWQEVYEYESQGLPKAITTEIQYRNQWIPEKRRQFEYTVSRILEAETIYLRDDKKSDLHWLPSMRMLYAYNANADLQSETIQTWHDSTQTWRNLYSELFVYDDNDRLIETVLRTWNHSNMSWRDLTASTVKYGLDGRLTEADQYNTAVGPDVALNAQSTVYDTTGNPGSITTSVWQNNAWIPVEKQVHFWSTVRRGIFADGEIHCYYPNPYALGAIWKCEGLKRDVEYVLDVYDLQGRHRHVRRVPIDGVFRIDGSLPSGYYTVVIRGGLDTHVEKVYVNR